MAIIFKESSLATSEVYNGINDLTGSNLLVKCREVILNEKTLTTDDLESVYVQLKQFPNVLTSRAVKAWVDGETIVKFNTGSRMDIFPFVSLGSKETGKRNNYVFLDKGRFAIVNPKNNALTVQPGIMHDLLVGALVGGKIRSNYDRFVSDTTDSMLQILMSIYIRFVCRILNREYAIGTDKIVFDVIQYWIGRFFVQRIFESRIDEGRIYSLFSKSLRYIDEIKKEEIKKLYDEKNPLKLSELIELIASSSPRLKDLNLSVFLDKWINYFYPPGLLGVDNIEYFIFMIITLLEGRNIISINASEMVKETKNIKIFREELIKLIQY